MYMICKDYSNQQMVWGLMNRGDNSRVMFGGSLRIFTGRGDPHCRNSSRRSRHASVIQKLTCSGFLKSRCWCTVSGCEHWFEPCSTVSMESTKRNNTQPESAIGFGHCSCETWGRGISNIGERPMLVKTQMGCRFEWYDDWGSTALMCWLYLLCLHVFRLYNMAYTNPVLHHHFPH